MVVRPLGSIPCLGYIPITSLSPQGSPPKNSLETLDHDRVGLLRINLRQDDQESRAGGKRSGSGSAVSWRLLAALDQQDGPMTSTGAEAAWAGVVVTTMSHPRCDVGGSTKLLSAITVFQPAGAPKPPFATVIGFVSQRS